MTSQSIFKNSPTVRGSGILLRNWRSWKQQEFIGLSRVVTSTWLTDWNIGPVTTNSLSTASAITAANTANHNLRWISARAPLVARAVVGGHRRRGKMQAKHSTTE